MLTVKKHLPALFALILTCLILAPHTEAQTIDEQAAERIKTYVISLGTGVDERVKVRLRDGSEARGYINSAGKDTFTIINPKSKEATNIAYKDVLEVSRDQKKSSYPVKKVLITGGVIFAVLAIFSVSLGG